MGKYITYKEDLEKALMMIAGLPKSDLPDDGKKEAYDRYKKQAQIAKTKILQYGAGKIFRFQTPKGVFYMVDIDKTDIPELIKDLGIESYLYTEIETMKNIKL